MKEQQKQYDIGVIIGRFQTNELHVAHIDLINTVIQAHKKVILFLGVAPVLGTRRNPLDFSTRKAMIEEQFGTKLSAILPLNDRYSNDAWSAQIDVKVREVFQIGSAVLYGSKDSFIPYYTGKLDTRVLEPETFVSATDVRNAVSKEIIASKEFRAGCIYATYNQFPIVYPTVDIAIFNSDYSKILLARKPEQTKYRFIGGFTDVTDENFEAAARREVMEETGLEVSNPAYVCSLNIKDWRYEKETTRTVMTTLFKTAVTYGAPQPMDDIEELKWFDVQLIAEDASKLLMPEHVKLFNTLYKNISK